MQYNRIPPYLLNTNMMNCNALKQNCCYSKCPGHRDCLLAYYAFIYVFIYLFHLFTQGKPKQLTLVVIGALHTFHIVTNMYVQFKHNTLQSNLREHGAY